MTRVWGWVGLVVTVLLIVACALPGPAARETAWTTTFTELHAPRSFAQTVALPAGQILVVGGFDPSEPDGMAYKTELIDPLVRRVTELPQRIVGRLHESATLIGGERVLVAGGVERLGDTWSPLDLVDVFDAKTRHWTRAAQLRTSRSDHAAVALADGSVLVIGGNQGTRILSSVERYDPATDSWKGAAALPKPRTQETAVRLADGRVLVAGGLDEHGSATDTSFLYDPVADAWSRGPLMVMPRVQHVAVPLPNGDVLFAGGDGAASGMSEVYLAHEERFVRSGTLVEPRMVAQAAPLPDGRVVVTGGLPPRIQAFTPITATELWDPLTGRWSSLPPAPSARAWGSLVFSDGAMFLISGSGNAEEPFTSVDRLTVR